MSLNPRQESFCHHFVLTGVAKRAYQLAGYSAKSERTAEVESSKFLRKPEIKAKIAELREELAERHAVDSAMIIETLLEIIHTPIGELIEKHERGEHSHLLQSTRPGKYGTSYQMVSKLQALKLLADICGFNSPVRHEVAVAETVNTYEVDEALRRKHSAYLDRSDIAA
ncbi:MAG: terminase small subunit [Verrucomicrobiales bacterium]|nr:terminase small subunit [Verrucomicrobiales bacterium]